MPKAAACLSAPFASEHSLYYEGAASSRTKPPPMSQPSQHSPAPHIAATKSGAESSFQSGSESSLRQDASHFAAAAEKPASPPTPPPSPATTTNFNHLNSLTHRYSPP